MQPCGIEFQQAAEAFASDDLKRGRSLFFSIASRLRVDRTWISFAQSGRFSSF